MAGSARPVGWRPHGARVRRRFRTQSGRLGPSCRRPEPGARTPQRTLTLPRAAGSVPEAGRSSTALLSQVRRDKLSRRGHCHKVTGDSSGRRADPGHGQSREALLACGGPGCDEMSFRLD